MLVSHSHLTGLVDFLANHEPLELTWSTPAGSSVTALTITTAQGVYTWASSPSLSSARRGPTIYAIDALLPAATAIVGAQDAKTQQFLDQLGVPHQSHASWSRHTSTRLAPLVASMAEENMASVRQQMDHETQDVKVSMDEQYSRPQRNATLGHAPYVSVNVTWEKTGQVCASTHVDRDKCASGSRDKKGSTRPTFRLTAAQAASFGRKVVFTLLAQMLLVNITHVGTDACSAAGTSVTQYLSPRWPDILHQHDLWHKTKGWSTALKDFSSNRLKKHSRQLLYPCLNALVNKSDTQLAGRLKRHFVWVSNNCEGHPDLFMELWEEAAFHYAQKYSLPENEVEAFTKWLRDLFAKDSKYFLHGMQTSNAESYHSVCNKYCPKGFKWSFSSYSMRKSLATLHWNHVVVKQPHTWRAELLDKYIAQFY